MKRLVAIVLALVMAVSFAGCGLFSDDSVVKFDELYTHKDPSGLKYDERKAMINKTFGEALEEAVNEGAYPSTIKYGDAGEILGIYDYDPETGMTSGYMDFVTGEFVEEVVDLGKPDESLMISLKGNVTLGCVIYGNEGKAIEAYLYAFLEDAADKEDVKSNMELYLGYAMTEESDKVLVCKKDSAAIDKQFADWQEYYMQTQSDRSVTGYAENLKLELGLKNYGVNPYKPSEGIKDPDNIEFDEKVILTSNGAYSFVDESLEKNLTVRTDVVYGYQGKVVAHYIYYEYNSKAEADKLMNAQEGNFYGSAVRVSDTLIQDKLDGRELQDVLASYIGYNILTDDSLEGYVTNVEETYFSMRYEQ